MELVQRGAYVDNCGVWHDHFEGDAAYRSDVSPNGNASAAIHSSALVVRHGSQEWTYGRRQTGTCQLCVSDGGIAICSDDFGYGIGVYADTKLAEFSAVHLLRSIGLHDTHEHRIARLAISGRRDADHYSLVCLYSKAGYSVLQLHLSSQGALKKLRRIRSYKPEQAFSVAVSTSDQPVSICATRVAPYEHTVLAFDVHTGACIWLNMIISKIQNSYIDVKAIGTGSIAVATMYSVSVLASGGNVLFIYEAVDAYLHNVYFSPNGNWLCTRLAPGPPRLACVGIPARILTLVLCSRRRYQRRMPPPELWQFIHDEFVIW